MACNGSVSTFDVFLYFVFYFGGISINKIDFCYISLLSSDCAKLTLIVIAYLCIHLDFPCVPVICEGWQFYFFIF